MSQLEGSNRKRKPDTEYGTRTKPRSRSKIKPPQRNVEHQWWSSSISLATKRKGFHLLKKIIPDIINMGIQIVVAGKSSQKIDNVKYLGAINNENLMAMAYNTCDAYVLPSLQDNLPNTMLESLACAKPVITFNHFGMGEVVKEGLNGFLSNEITADGLLKSITRWVNFYKSKNNTDDFYSRIRLEVEQQFNQEKQLKMYLKVFEQV